jgi:signal transduction histidine kinase
MGNICKYSLPGTRVYLNAAAYGNVCIISFKNISRTELNISADELVERFVRADSSRSTEGNGLGLSIAQSLVELQGGKLEITADGDLFKVNLQFPILPPEKTTDPI